MKKWAGRISIAVGLALIIAGIGDYVSYLWTREPSPSPWFVPLIFIALGFLLLFPERLGIGIGYLRDLLPWFRSRSD